MKLQGTFITNSYFGILPLFGSRNFGGLPQIDTDGLPLTTEGTNGDSTLHSGYVVSGNGQIYLYFLGSLAQAGQPIPVKSIKFVNNTVPAGSLTMLQSDFNNGAIESGFIRFDHAPSYKEPLTHWTATGGDDIDIEIEFDNSVIGIA